MSTSACGGCDGRATDSASACSQNATLTYPPGMQVIERGWVSSNSIVFTDPADAAGRIRRLGTGKSAVARRADGWLIAK